MSTKADRLLLLDASNYIFRAYHATSARSGFESSLTTSAGMPVNALLVFTNMLRKLIRDLKPTHVACVLDAPGAKATRQAEYPEYKKNRAETPPDLVVQLPFMRPIAKALGLTLIEEPGIEADDLIATLAKQAGAQGIEAVMVSSDKDLYQLLDQGVRLYDGMKDKWIDAAACIEKFGVGPDKVVEVQGLIGDAVDNIPGVDGVGPKTAAKLIADYGTIDGVYEHLAEVKGKLKEKLEAGRESAFISRQLARLRLDVPLDLDLPTLILREPDADALVKLFTELEFKGLLREFQSVKAPAADVTRVTVRDSAALDDLLTSLSMVPVFALQGLFDRSPYSRAGLVALAFSVPAFAGAAAKSWYLPLRHRQLDSGVQLPIAETLSALTPWLTAEHRPRRAAHSWKELGFVLAREGVVMAGVGFDTELASYLANATKYTHSLENIALDLLEAKLPEVPPDVDRGRHGRDEVALQTAEAWALARVEAVLSLIGPLGKALDASEGRKLFTDLELPMSDVLLGLELEGVRVDVGILKGLSGRFETLMGEAAVKCFALAGTTFNMGSPKQLAEVLFDRLGLPVKKRTKTGPSTDASVLEELAEEAPVVQAILDWRELSKLKGTYTDVLPTLVDPRTSRIHTSFRQAVAATGRLSSFDPNLQNIPIRSEEGRRIRDAFIPRDGNVLLSADYSQVELRILAHLCRDPGLLRAFADRVDVHRRTASEIFDVPEGEVTYEHRAAAKAINFGLMYGMSAFRLARDLQISRKQAQDYMDRYFERYSAIKAFMEATKEEGRELGYVTTVLGRRRYVPDLRAKDFTRRAAAERMAINTPVQGSAADIIKLAMLEVARILVIEGFEARMVLQVHDELVFDVPEHEAERLAPQVQAAMSGVLPLAVPLDVQVGWGKTWNAAH